MKNVTRYTRYLPHLVILLLPFVLLCRIAPGLSELTIGNDYVLYSIREQVELQSALKHGDFPLFVPGFACGRTVAALTLGQLYHPLPHLAAMLPGYFDGAALTINTLLRFFSLAIAHLLLFVLLSRLKLSRLIAFTLSLITVYNLRMLDLFRYGASLENYTGHLFLIAAMGFYFLKPTRVLGPVSVIISTYLLLCGGHPQMMYYGLWAAFISGLAIPFVLPAISPECAKEKGGVLGYYKAVALCLFAGFLLSLAYILPFCTEFLLDNEIRVNRGYSWSLSNQDNLAGALSNFFSPLKSDVHGAFGGSSLILLTLGLPLLKLQKIKVPKTVWALFIGYLLLFLCGMGKLTPVHYWFWKLFPLADSFRTPGRINMILPVISCFLTAFVFSRSAHPVAIRGKAFTVRPVFQVAAVAVAAYAVYFVFTAYSPSDLPRWAPEKFLERPKTIDTAIFTSGLVSLLFATLLGLSAHMGARIRSLIKGALCIAVLIQTGAALNYGTWQKHKKNTSSYARYLKDKKSNIRARVTSGYGMESALITEQIKNAALEPKLAKFYRDYKVADTDKRALRFIQKKRRADQAVIVAPTGKPSLCADKTDKKKDRILLTHGSYNRLVFDVDARRDGLFTVSFPFASNWQAFVNDAKKAVYKANGYELGVPLKKGFHQVELRYVSPFHLAGIGISGLTFCVLGIFFSAVSFGRKRPKLCCAFSAVSVLLGAGVIALPSSRMYSGESFGSRYRWSTSNLPPKDNLAYSKQTKMAPMQSDENPYYQYSGLAVDGDRRTRGFLTHKRRRAWWQVDLGKVHPIKLVDIYYKKNLPLPLIVSVSDNRKKFTPVHTVKSQSKKRPLRIPLKVNARYLRIESRKKGNLSLTEVEVY